MFSAPASTGALAGNSQLYQEASAKRFNALKKKKISLIPASVISLSLDSCILGNTSSKFKLDFSSWQCYPFKGETGSDIIRPVPNP